MSSPMGMPLSLIFPCYQLFGPENGSHMTPHTATESLVLILYNESRPKTVRFGHFQHVYHQKGTAGELLLLGGKVRDGKFFSGPHFRSPLPPALLARH